MKINDYAPSVLGVSMDLFGLGSCLTQTQLEHFGWGRLELATDREGTLNQMDWASSGGRWVLVRVGFGRGVEISLDLAKISLY